MALTTRSVQGTIDTQYIDNTPEAEVRFDSEGKGYLYIKKTEEPKVEEPKVKEPIKVIKKKKVKK